MLVLFCLVSILIVPFKSKCRLEAENVALRHQVMVLRRQLGGRVHLTNFDQLFLVQLYHWFPSIRRVLTVVQPETLVRWHRAGFRCYWRWKSRSRGGRPQISVELRAFLATKAPSWTHGISLLGKLKYPAGFAQFDYVNAPCIVA